MQKRNVPRNVHTHSALMNVCIKCGQLRLALECWENMQREAIEPNVVSAITHMMAHKSKRRVAACVDIAQLVQSLAQLAGS